MTSRKWIHPNEDSEQIFKTSPKFLSNISQLNAVELNCSNRVIPETPLIIANAGLAERVLFDSGISGDAILGTGAAGPEDWCRLDTPGIGVEDREPIPAAIALSSATAADADAASRRWAKCWSSAALAASPSSFAALLDDLEC